MQLGWATTSLALNQSLLTASDPGTWQLNTQVALQTVPQKSVRLLARKGVITNCLHQVSSNWGAESVRPSASQRSSLLPKLLDAMQRNLAFWGSPRVGCCQTANHPRVFRIIQAISTAGLTWEPVWWADDCKDNRPRFGRGINKIRKCTVISSLNFV